VNTEIAPPEETVLPKSKQPPRERSKTGRTRSPANVVALEVIALAVILFLAVAAYFGVFANAMSKTFR
jgi:hypothetical protein